MDNPATNPESRGIVALSKRMVWPLGALLLVMHIIQLSPVPIGPVLFVLFPALIVACAVAPAAKALERFRIPRWITILGVYALIVAIFAGVIALVVPIVIEEGNGLKGQLPKAIEAVRELVARFSPEQAQKLSGEALAESLSGVIGGATVELSKMVGKVVTLSIHLVIILVAAFFLVVDDKKPEQVIRRFMPTERHDTAMRVFGHITTRIGAWVRAQLLLALFFGFFFGLGLQIAGVKHAWTLGLVGAILETIPFVGGIITVSLAVLIALTQDPVLALWVLGLYLVVVKVQGNVLAPKLMDKVVGINPLLAILAIFVGGETTGILGAFFALPVVIVLQAIIDEIFPPVTPAVVATAPPVPAVDPTQSLTPPVPGPDDKPKTD